MLQLMAYRGFRRGLRRLREGRYWGYVLAIALSHHIGETLALVLTANQASAGAIAAVGNGSLFVTLLGFTLAYVASQPVPTEAEVLRKVAQRKLAEALVDGSEDSDRLMVWHSILENTTDDHF